MRSFDYDIVQKFWLCSFYWTILTKVFMDSVDWFEYVFYLTLTAFHHSVTDTLLNLDVGEGVTFLKVTFGKIRESINFFRKWSTLSLYSFQQPWRPKLPKDRMTLRIICSSVTLEKLLELEYFAWYLSGETFGSINNIIWIMSTRNSKDNLNKLYWLKTILTSPKEGIFSREKVLGRARSRKIKRGFFNE